MNFGNRSTELTDALMVKLQNCNLLENLKLHGAKHKLKKGKPSEVQCHSKLSKRGNAKVQNFKVRALLKVADLKVF